MVNVDAPFGLRPLRYLNGSPWNGQATMYHVDSGYATALFIGDPVDLVGTGDATGKYQNVQKATLADTNRTIGPIVAVYEDPSKSLDRAYLPASTGGYVLVADDPNLIFEVQVDSAGTLAIADLGQNGILIETHSGSTITGLSGIEFDEDSTAANSSLMIQTMKLVDRPDNALGLHCNIEVLISTHRYGFTGTDYGRLGA